VPGWLRAPLMIVGCVVLAGLAVQIVVGVAFGSNTTDARKYGKVEVPGQTILHLPAGKLDISLMELTYSTVDIPARLRVAVVPLEGHTPLPLERNVGGEFGGGSRTSTVAYKRIWKADIPRAGAYRVTASGSTGDRIYSLEFGHAPLAIGVKIWEYTGLAALAGLLLWLVTRAIGLPRAPRRRADLAG
jgi:hypothetical protein